MPDKNINIAIELKGDQLKVDTCQDWEKLSNDSKLFLIMKFLPMLMDEKTEVNNYIIDDPSRVLH